MHLQNVAIIVWTTAAFGEEMFFRGYFVTRLQTVQFFLHFNRGDGKDAERACIGPVTIPIDDIST